METTGPGIAREAVGPLRHLLTGRATRLPKGRGIVFRYGPPLGLLALIGLAVANNQYLLDNRDIDGIVSGLLSIGAVVPVAIAVRRPLVAWRIAYPLLLIGPINVNPREAWPWPPVQIIGFLVVLLMLAITEGSAVAAWATGLSIAPPFIFFTDQANAFGVAVLVVAVALLGDVLSRRRNSRVQLAEQAELTELERARRAVLEERARIAREMHDVVAHHMSMIAVQAETAPFRVAELSGPAREELAGIATSARSALTDMRRLLGVLRSESEDAPREPQPGLADLPALITTARRAGVPVAFWTAGRDGIPDLFTPSDDAADFAGVPGPVGLAAYRIAQEALANAARHAPGGDVRVLVRALADRLDVTVHNGPPASGSAVAAQNGQGHGLTGMRERAGLLGGELTAGPDERGGYRVTAVLPYPDGAE